MGGKMIFYLELFLSVFFVLYRISWDSLDDHWLVSYVVSSQVKSNLCTWETYRLLLHLRKLRRSLRISVNLSKLKAWSLGVERSAFYVFIWFLAIFPNFCLYADMLGDLCRMLVFATHLLSLKTFLASKMQSRYFVCFKVIQTYLLSCQYFIFFSTFSLEKYCSFLQRSHLL